MTFIDGVILFENQRLPGFETDKSDMEFIKLLDAASKVPDTLLEKLICLSLTDDALY